MAMKPHLTLNRMLVHPIKGQEDTTGESRDGVPDSLKGLPWCIHWRDGEEIQSEREATPEGCKIFRGSEVYTGNKEGLGLKYTLQP